MNNVDMMHIVIATILVYVISAELTRKGMVLPLLAHQMDKVYSLFTRVRNPFNRTEKRDDARIDRLLAEAKLLPMPTWWEMVNHHGGGVAGYEKVLLGLVNSWRQGIDPQTEMRHIPAKVLKWVAHWSKWSDSLSQRRKARRFANELRAEDEAMEAAAQASEEESYDREEKRINQMGRLGLTNGDEEVYVTELSNGDVFVHDLSPDPENFDAHFGVAGVVVNGDEGVDCPPKVGDDPLSYCFECGEDFATEGYQEGASRSAYSQNICGPCGCDGDE